MPSSTTVTRVRRATPRLTRLAVAQMTDLPWFTALSAEQRAWAGLVVQQGLALFGRWLGDPAVTPVAEPGIFAVAPRQLTRAVSLSQTVALIRVTVEVVETAVPELASRGDEVALEQAVLRYSREVAFAAAEVYAAAAEERGAWDARWEASVVEALVRDAADATVLARAASLGWAAPSWVVVLAGGVPPEAPSELRAWARRTGHGLLVGESAGRLLVVLGGDGDRTGALAEVTGAFAAGPVVVGPAVPVLAQAGRSVREALAGLEAVAGWPTAPRPVEADALLAERVVLGDPDARRRLLSEVHTPLVEAGGDLLVTAATYLEGGGSVEGTARALFVHPNTVRYRLKKLSVEVGLDLTDPRDAQVVRLSLVLGRSLAAGTPSL